ncbi:MAG: TonB-dependent receptor, partial [Pseudomonadota bacterium]|nr:TonB-dependent receptor [Pseudomonadota bacterium]
MLAPDPFWAQAQQEALPAAPVAAQPAPGYGAIPPTADDPLLGEFADEETIVVTGARPRGSVVGDIPPEDSLDPRDIRATGATSIAELLEAVAAQTGSARGRGGGRPILLLNGLR